MAGTAQKTAIRNYRTQPVKRGMARFEVLGLDTDRDSDPIACEASREE